MPDLTWWQEISKYWQEIFVVIGVFVAFAVFLLTAKPDLEYERDFHNYMEFFRRELDRNLPI